MALQQMIDEKRSCFHLIWGQTIRICKALVMTENLSKTTFLLVQIGPWSMPAGCEELARGFEPIRNGEIFCVK